MIADWQTNKIYFSELLKMKFPLIWSEIKEVLGSRNIMFDVLPKTNDIWTRDYMPIQVSHNKFIEYRYDPDYLQGNSDKKETRELKTYPDIVCDSISLKTNKSSLILDGGNIVKSTNSIILTDKIVWENNKHYTRKKLIKELHETFQVEKVIIIPWDELCPYGHSDGMLRFINNDTVLLSGFYRTIDSNFRKRFLKSIQEAELNYDWLKCSEKKEKESSIAYINFLQTQDIILVPKLNKKEDEMAIEQISKYYPDYTSKDRISQIEMKDIVKKGGALNCISWTIKI